MDEMARYGGGSSAAATSSRTPGFDHGWNTVSSSFPSNAPMDGSRSEEILHRGRASTMVQVEATTAESAYESSAIHKRDAPASSTSRLLSFKELPSWHQDNPYIHSHYRTISHSVMGSLSSLTYLHNETMNIYTHLVPAVLFLTLQCLSWNYFSTHYPAASRWDMVILTLFFLSAAVCLGMSATYHTLMNHSRGVSEMMLRLDFVGIIVLILGKFVSGIYVGFYCEPFLRNIYFTMILALGSATTTVLVRPKYQGLRYRKFRLALFIGTALSAFAPLGHSLWIFGWQQNWRQSGTPYYLLEGVILAIGAIFYSLRFPESWRPGRFDVWGSSHQIFHVLVVLAACVHLWGIGQAYQYAYSHRVCGPAAMLHA